VFTFLSELDRGDTITDFTRQNNNTDKFDVSAIDADKTNAVGSNDVFQWGGTTPTKHALWTVASGSDTLIYGDTNGDVTTVEFFFTAQNLGTQLVSSDFIL
jgi:hypothetical protein